MNTARCKKTQTQTEAKTRSEHPTGEKPKTAQVRSEKKTKRKAHSKKKIAAPTKNTQVKFSAPL